MNINVNWTKIEEDLNGSGFSHLSNILSGSVCDDLKEIYGRSQVFRKKIIMTRHNFGRGEYQYFDYPLPPVVGDLRSGFYEGLSPVANRWSSLMKWEKEFPDQHADYLEFCQSRGQARPTPLMLKYEEGDYNCLHQDLYGDEVFPLQVALCLSDPDTDFSGGEFVLTHQRPRMQSVVDVLSLQKGDAVVFPVRERPCAGKRGFYKVNMRHGVSKVRSGNRFVLGLIFHDAQ